MQKKVWYAPNKFESYGEEEIKAVETCLREGWLAGFGPRSIEFEEKIAKRFGKKYGVFVYVKPNLIVSQRATRIVYD